jgi:MFS family permease
LASDHPGRLLEEVSRSSNPDQRAHQNSFYRTNIAQARLNTFEKDLGMSGDDYNNAVAVLTIGYMLAQLPSNMLLTRVRPGIYLPVAAVVWSAVSAATAGVKNSSQLIVVRFFLGILEAPLFPGVSQLAR